MYVFDDSDDQMPPAYMAKTPIPLRSLATSRAIRGEEEEKLEKKVFSLKTLITVFIGPE